MQQRADDRTLSFGEEQFRAAARALHYLGEPGVQVETCADPLDGRAEGGNALAQRYVGPPQPIGASKSLPLPGGTPGEPPQRRNSR